MLPIWRIFYKTFVMQFYRSHAGFFFLIAMFGGSFLRAEDHIALASYIFDSPLLLVLLWALWGLYHSQTVFFVWQKLLFNSHSFLYYLTLIDRRKRLLLLWAMQWVLWLPVVAYAAFVGFYAFIKGHHVAVLSTAIFLLFMPLTAVFAYEYRLQRPNPDKVLSVLNGRFNKWFTKPYFSFFLLYLLRIEPVLLFLTKAFTVGVIVGLCVVYPTDDYDERLLSLGALLIGIVQTSILMQLYQFEHLQLPILRNLPIKTSSRLGQYVLLFGILLLPETIAFCRYLPKSVDYIYVGQWACFLLSVCCLIFGRLLQKHYTADDILQHCFYYFIALFFCIMFKIPILVLAAANFAWSIWLFSHFYYESKYIVSA